MDIFGGKVIGSENGIECLFVVVVVVVVVVVDEGGMRITSMMCASLYV